MIELELKTDSTDLAAGEKRQVSLELNSPAPLGMSVVMLRFDPAVLKVANVTAGKMFADAKTAPTITLMKNEDGVLLLSLAPGAPITGAGSLLNVEFEAVGSGESSVAFDLSNVHLVTSDGSGSVLDLSSPLKFTVKAANPKQ